MLVAARDTAQWQQGTNHERFPGPLRARGRPPSVLTLNRADKRNALSRRLIAALTEAFERARDDAAARCVDPHRGRPGLLRRHGPGRIAGIAGDRRKEPTPVWDDALRLAKLYDLIYTLPKPTIAAVNGAAVAGGAGLVTVCDLAVAVPEAKFGYPEVRRGLVAAMVMPHLLRHVGERMAPLPAADRRADRRRRGPACRPDQRGRCRRPAAGPRRCAGAKRWPKAGRTRWRKTKELLHQFSQQALSIEEAAQAQRGAAPDGGMPAGPAGVLRQAAGAVGSQCTAIRTVADYNSSGHSSDDLSLRNLIMRTDPDRQHARKPSSSGPTIRRNGSRPSSATRPSPSSATACRAAASRST